MSKHDLYHVNADEDQYWRKIHPPHGGYQTTEGRHHRLRDLVQKVNNRVFAAWRNPAENNRSEQRKEVEIDQQGGNAQH